MASEVYQRYYGFMLGFMLDLLRLDFAAPCYEAHRRRMEEVMSEVGIEWKLPDAHSAYTQDHRLGRDLIVELKCVGQTLADFYAFGYSALRAMIDPESEAGRAATRTLEEIISERDLDPGLVWDRTRRGWDGGLEGDQFIAELMSRAYDLVEILLMPAPKEERTCFVIMPFAPPFRDYYEIFYRKSLTLAGYEAIRAWEGVTNEHYLQMIFALMHRSSAALADLSAENHSNLPNLNVIHEIGINMGAGNVSYLLAQSGELRWPSNLSGLPYVTYDPTASDWPNGQARDVSLRLREIDQARSEGDTPAVDQKSTLDRGTA